MASDQEFVADVAAHKKVNDQANKLDRKIERGVFVSDSSRKEVSATKRKLSVRIQSKVRTHEAAQEAA